MVKLKCKNEYFRIRGVFVKINLRLVAIILSLALILSSALVFSGCEGEIIAENSRPDISSNISSENTTSKSTPSNSSTLPSATTKPSSTVSVEKPKVENDNSPGTIWESAYRRIIIEFNKNKIHKCYVGKYDEKDEYYLKIDEEKKTITFYSSSEMKKSQIIETEQWTIKSGSFNGEKVNIITSVSSHYNDPDKIITLYNKGRNPINDPDISYKKAESIAKQINEEREKFDNVKYRGIENDYGVKCYVFDFEDDPKPEGYEGFYHQRSGWIKINAKTGEEHNYASCC